MLAACQLRTVPPQQINHTSGQGLLRRTVTEDRGYVARDAGRLGPSLLFLERCSHSGNWLQKSQDQEPASDEQNGKKYRRITGGATSAKC